MGRVIVHESGASWHFPNANGVLSLLSKQEWVARVHIHSASSQERLLISPEMTRCPGHEKACMYVDVDGEWETETEEALSC